MFKKLLISLFLISINSIYLNQFNINKAFAQNTTPLFSGTCKIRGGQTVIPKKFTLTKATASIDLTKQPSDFKIEMEGEAPGNIKLVHGFVLSREGSFTFNQFNSSKTEKVKLIITNEDSNQIIIGLNRDENNNKIISKIRDKAGVPIGSVADYITITTLPITITAPLDSINLEEILAKDFGQISSNDFDNTTANGKINISCKLKNAMISFVGSGIPPIPSE
jgi:hypothetical protein